MNLETFQRLKFFFGGVGACALLCAGGGLIAWKAGAFSQDGTKVNNPKGEEQVLGSITKNPKVNATKLTTVEEVRQMLLNYSANPCDVNIDSDFQELFITTFYNNRQHSAVMKGAADFCRRQFELRKANSLCCDYLEFSDSFWSSQSALANVLHLLADLKVVPDGTVNLIKMESVNLPAYLVLDSAIVEDIDSADMNLKPLYEAPEAYRKELLGTVSSKFPLRTHRNRIRSFVMNEVFIPKCCSWTLFAIGGS